ncbi:MAG: DUF1153 domain-containing protein [Alphaproteobacteria bacterium]|nr:DUF1153 domain-containing protein [Alphaproteobacteria bacterium]
MPSNEPIAADRDKVRLLSGLPPAETQRWTCRRKAAVVAAIRGGVLSSREACERYELSLEELAAWEAALDRDGIPGLRVTRLQIYRGSRLGKR